MVRYVAADDLDECSPYLPRYDAIVFLVLKYVDER